MPSWFGTAITAIVAWMALPAASSQVVYVDDDASLGGDGFSWSAPCRHLQDALELTRNSGGTITEVRVAGGVYKPDMAEHASISVGLRTETFGLIDGVALRGGYAGLSDPGNPDARDPNTQVSTLSGDLSGDDLANFVNCADNSYHVVTASGNNASALLEGFVISGGNANGPSTDSNGGGLLNAGAPTIEKCVFSSNQANAGAGIYNIGSDSIITRCKFLGNQAGLLGAGGGGIWNEMSSPTITHCVFQGNVVAGTTGGVGVFNGGAGLFNLSGSPVVSDCTFSNNVAPVDGGGVLNRGSSATLRRCIFTSNSAREGGAIANTDSSTLLLVRCAFVQNQSSGVAPRGGGAIAAEASILNLWNCRFQGNTAVADGGGIRLFDASDATFANCTFVGNGAGGTGGALNLSGSGAGGESDASLVNCSLYENQGGGCSLHHASGGLVTIRNSIMWNLAGPQMVISTGTADVAYSNLKGGQGSVPGGTLIWGVGNVEPAGEDPLFVRNPSDGGDGWGVGANDDYGDLRLALGSPCIDAGDNGAVPPDIADLDSDLDLLEATALDLGDATRFADDEMTIDTGNGVAPVVDLGAYEVQAVITTLYVDDDATAGGDGHSWATAYRYLQDALAAASDPNKSVTEIRIAGGVYRPDQSEFDPNLVGDRAATFGLVSGVSLKGSFAGLAGSDPNSGISPDDRDTIRFESVISGDLAGDDAVPASLNLLNNEPTRDDNSYILVTADDPALSSATSVEGFVFTGGHADGSFPFNLASAILLRAGASPVIRDCLFVENSAAHAVLAEFSSPILDRCVFRRNTGDSALGVFGGQTVVRRCSFLSNVNSGSRGGAIAIFAAGELTVISCLLAGNHASDSGAIQVQSNSTCALVNCVITGNRAAQGGAMSVFSGCEATVSSCTVVNNSAALSAGAFRSDGSLAIRNSVLWGNTDPSGSGEASQISVTGGAVSVTHTLVQGLAAYAGSGNLDAEPLFLDADGPDNAAGTADDDLRPGAGSPLIDAGDNSLLPVDLADLDDDGDANEPTPFDADGNARLFDDPNTPDTGSGGPPTIDLGALEYVGAPTARPPNIVYVDDDAPIGGDGATWQRGYRYLQDALAHARTRQAVTEIRLAQGTYWPDQSVDVPLGTGSRSSTFQIPVALSVRGGFAGLTNPDPNQSDPSVFKTTLDGDLLRNDIPGLVGSELLNDPSRQDNSYQVVTLIQLDASPATTSLRGLTIRNGNANDASHSTGGGLVNLGSNVRLDTCDIAANSAQSSGGGVYSARVASETGQTWGDNTEFRDNYAGFRGGGYYQLNAHCRLTECRFIQNESGNSGGGLGAGRPSLEVGPSEAVVRLLDCQFESNVSSAGGALGLSSVESVVQRCAIEQNRAINAGGGLQWNGSSAGDNLQVQGCAFLGNAATEGSGGACSVSPTESAGQVRIESCTFRANTAGIRGGGVEANAGTPNVSVNVTNSVFWANSVNTSFGRPSRAGLADFSQFAVSEEQASSVILSYCLIQGGWSDSTSVGIIDRDPRFAAGGFALLSGSPCIDAGDPMSMSDPNKLDIDGELFVVDGDLDGQPRIDLGADEFIDIDADRLPDAWEFRYQDLSMDPNGDSDADGLTNEEEFGVTGTDPLRTPIYVCAACDPNGDGTLSRPFGTIQAGLDAAVDGDAVLAISDVNTTYAGAGNNELDFDQKSIVLRARGPGAAIIDCGAAGRAVMGESVMSGFATLDGFEIRNGAAPEAGGLLLDGVGLALRGCSIRDNDGLPPIVAAGGLRADNAALILDDVTFSDNADPPSASWVDSFIYLRGVLSIDGAATVELNVRSSWITGPGQIALGELGRVVFADEAFDPVLRSDVCGLGDIFVARNVELVVENGATIDLSGNEPSADCNAPCPDVTQAGSIFAEGTLLLRNASVTNTNVDVGLGCAEDSTQIVNNDIRLAQTSVGFGGEFFVEGTSVVKCNDIVSEGDRYLDLDPDPTVPLSQRPLICNNTFSVVIQQGVTGEQGELLELRTEDFDLGLNGGLSGAYELSASSGYADTWVLEELEVLPDAKVNLTNREGFVFQDAGITNPEAIYVKTLKMHDRAVLNTALQRLYYQSLVDGAGQPLAPPDPNDPEGTLANDSKILDVPLLGFSLKVIEMEDDTEFDVRVRSRTTDPIDDQPNPLNPSLIGSVARINDPGFGGVMEMKTRAPGKVPATSVAAHGAFGRAGIEDILISFDYQFRQESVDPANPTELIVYLSDAPEVSTNLRQVARILPPSPMAPGGVNSNELRTYEASFPAGDLNFRRGTYVELELRGPDSVLIVDDFDPTASCVTDTCADFDGDFTTSSTDYLILASYANSATTPELQCLDDAFAADGYVDVQDVLSFDARGGTDLNACGSGIDFASHGGPAKPPGLSPAARLLMAGKLSDPNAVLQDRLVTLGGVQQCLDVAQLPASVPNPPGLPLPGYHANGRLLQANDGALYQLHATQGLLSLETAQPVLMPGVGTLPDGRTVYVGRRLQKGSGFVGQPISDAVFEPSNPSVLFVTPVVVQPSDFDAADLEPNRVDDPDATRRYLAAAKLTLTGSGGFVVDQVYGLDPRLDPEVHEFPPPSPTLREIEVDTLGNVYVLQSGAVNARDQLRIHESTSEGRLATISLVGDLGGPTAMLVSPFAPDTLYLSESRDTLGNGQSRVLRYPIHRSSGQVTGLGMPDTVVVDASTVDLDPITPSYADPNDALAVTTALAMDPNGVLYCSGFVMPRLLGYGNLEVRLAAKGTLAKISPGDAGPVLASPLNCNGVDLPISLVYLATTGSVCSAQCDVAGGDADVNDDCVVDLSDLAQVLANFGVAGATAGDGDTNGDTNIDLTDLANVLSRFGTSCP